MSAQTHEKIDGTLLITQGVLFTEKIDEIRPFNSRL